MRLHGNRNPQEGYGAEQIGSGSDNEIWSFGDEAYEISKKYIFLRERLRDYIRYVNSAYDTIIDEEGDGLAVSVMR